MIGPETEETVMKKSFLTKEQIDYVVKMMIGAIAYSALFGFLQGESILKDMEAGVCGTQRKYLVITDRRQAIATAAALSAKGDLILIAGKGHETYQEICGVRHHFDDMEEIKNILK